MAAHGGSVRAELLTSSSGARIAEEGAEVEERTLEVRDSQFAGPLL